jgi:hypothetical protein
MFDSLFVDLAGRIEIELSTMIPVVPAAFLVIKGLRMPCSYLPNPLPYHPMFSIIFFTLS